MLKEGGRPSEASRGSGRVDKPSGLYTTGLKGWVPGSFLLLERAGWWHHLGWSHFGQPRPVLSHANHSSGSCSNAILPAAPPDHGERDSCACTRVFRGACFGPLLIGRAALLGRGFLRDGVVNNDSFRRSASRSQ